MNKSAGQYINDIRRDYSLYILQYRAIPSMCDGMRSSSRRVIWTARDGKKVKSATLAGATMPIHPHAPPESTINTLAAPYGNNIPLLKGHGAFGTMVAPSAFSASRYTSASLSQFTKDAVLVDMDLVPMQENYDSTLEEPVHFLPLIPVVLLNPTEGVAIGHACNILPRSLKDIINAQLQSLSNKKVQTPKPYFKPLDQYGEPQNNRYAFTGSFERVNTTTVRITNIPYGLSHTKLVTDENSILLKLLDNDDIVDFTDNTKDVFDVEVKFKRGVLQNYSDDQLLTLLGLKCTITENLTVLTLDHEGVTQTDFEDIINQFTTWRLSFYKQRYQLLVDCLIVDIAKLKDIITAIDNDAGHVAVTMKDRAQFCSWLKELGIVHVDYIASLPTYKYTKAERTKIEKQIVSLESTKTQYQQIVDSPIKQRNVYKKELQHILEKYG